MTKERENFDSQNLEYINAKLDRLRALEEQCDSIREDVNAWMQALENTKFFDIPKDRLPGVTQTYDRAQRSACPDRRLARKRD